MLQRLENYAFEISNNTLNKYQLSIAKSQTRENDSHAIITNTGFAQTHSPYFLKRKQTFIGSNLTLSKLYDRSPQTNDETE